MESLYNYLLSELGDDDDLRLAFGFEELISLLSSHGVKVAAEGKIDFSESEDLRECLVELASSMNLSHPDTLVSINEYVSAGSHELAGFGIHVRRNYAEEAC